MKTIRNLFLLTLVFVMNIPSAKSQNQFLVSQYMLHHAFVNPAAIANSNRINGAAFYRSQWTGFSGAPVLQGLNFNMPFGGGKNAAGLTVLHDKIGVNRDIQISGTYAYRAKVGLNKYLAFGLSASLSLLQSDFGAVETTQPNDPIFTASTPTFAMPNFKAGLYFFTPKFYAGVSLPNLLENKIVYATEYSGETGFNAKALHLYLNAGYSFEISDKFNLNFSTMLKNVSGAPLQIDLNTTAVFNKKFGIGASYRTSKELVGLINFQIDPSWKLAYAYDFNFDRIGNYSNGSHEIMIIFNLVPTKAVAILESPRF